MRSVCFVLSCWVINRGIAMRHRAFVSCHHQRATGSLHRDQGKGEFLGDFHLPCFALVTKGMHRIRFLITGTYYSNCSVVAYDPDSVHRILPVVQVDAVVVVVDVGAKESEWDLLEVHRVVQRDQI